MGYEDFHADNIHQTHLDEYLHASLVACKEGNLF